MAKKKGSVLPSLPNASSSRYGGSLQSLDDDDSASVGAHSLASYDNDTGSLLSSLDAASHLGSSSASISKYNMYGVQGALRRAKQEDLEKRKLVVGLEKLRQQERDFYKSTAERQKKKLKSERRKKRRADQAQRKREEEEAEARRQAAANPSASSSYSKRKEETSFAALTKTSLMQHASSLPTLPRPASPLQAALESADADFAMEGHHDGSDDQYSHYSLDSSVPETLDGPSVGGGDGRSLADGSLVSSHLSMMSGPHVSSAKIMASALSRFHKRAQHYEKHHELEAQSRRLLVEKLTSRQRRVKAERERRDKVLSQQKWLTIAKVAKFLPRAWAALQEGKSQLTEHRLQNVAATFLQKSIKRANARRLWFVYADFYAKVNKSGKWMFLLGTKIWRKKRAAKVVKTFLEENKNRNQMATMVKIFLLKIRRVQVFARSYLAVHEQRIVMLEDIWAEAETKYLKKLEGQIKVLRQMKTLTVTSKSGINLKDVRDFNQTVDAWSQINNRMEQLLQTEREKNHLPKNQNASLNIKKVPKERRREVLGNLLRAYRKKHVQDLNLLREKILAEKKRKAKCRFATEDVTAILGLNKINGDVHEQMDEDVNVQSKNIPFFMFWTMFGTKEELNKTVEDLYRKTYDEAFGNPVEEYKQNMTRRREQVDGHNHRQHQKDTKEHHRKYAVSVQTYVQPLSPEKEIPLMDLSSAQENKVGAQGLHEKFLHQALKIVERVDESEIVKTHANVHQEREVAAREERREQARKAQEEHEKEGVRKANEERKKFDEELREHNAQIAQEYQERKPRATMGKGAPMQPTATPPRSNTTTPREARKTLNKSALEKAMN